MGFYYVYVLQSLKIDWIYVGSTSDLRTRFKSHNNGENLSTKSYRPLKLIFYEAYLKEIFVMDAILDGRVRRDVINNSFDINDYLRQLNASASSTKSVEFLFRISKSIYESGSNLTNYAPAYADMINAHYRRDRGFDIYQLNQSGTLEYLP